MRLFCRRLETFTFWGWQAVDTLHHRNHPGQGVRGARADLHPHRIAYAVVFIVAGKVRHIYVANWFFAAFILG